MTQGVSLAVLPGERLHHGDAELLPPGTLGSRVPAQAPRARPQARLGLGLGLGLLRSVWLLRTRSPLIQ